MRERHIVLLTAILTATLWGCGSESGEPENDATDISHTDDTGNTCEVPGSTLEALLAYQPHENAAAEELAIACGEGGLLADMMLADRIARDFDAIRAYDGRVNLAESPVSTISVNYIYLMIEGDLRVALEEPDFPWPCFHDHLRPTLGAVRYRDYVDPPFTSLYVHFDGVFNLPLLEDAYASVADGTTTETRSPLLSPGSAVNLRMGSTIWQYDWNYVVDDVTQYLMWQVDEDGVVRLVGESCHIVSGRQEHDYDCARLEGGPDVEEAVPVDGVSCGAGHMLF